MAADPRPGHTTSPVSLEIVPAHCGDGYESGRIQGKARAIRPDAADSLEKAIANRIKRAHGYRMHNKRVGAGLFAKGISA
jgi:hypothetical protein